VATCGDGRTGTSDGFCGDGLQKVEKWKKKSQAPPPRDPPATPGRQGSLRPAAYSVRTVSSTLRSLGRTRAAISSQASHFSPLFCAQPLRFSTDQHCSWGLIFLRTRQPSTRTDIALVRGAPSITGVHYIAYPGGGYCELPPALPRGIGKYCWVPGCTHLAARRPNLSESTAPSLRPVQYQNSLSFSVGFAWPVRLDPSGILYRCRRPFTY
jgi:hypothetical protein